MNTDTKRTDWSVQDTWKILGSFREAVAGLATACAAGEFPAGDGEACGTLFGWNEQLARAVERLSHAPHAGASARDRWPLGVVRSVGKGVQMCLARLDQVEDFMRRLMAIKSGADCDPGVRTRIRAAIREAVDLLRLPENIVERGGVAAAEADLAEAMAGVISRDQAESPRGVGRGRQGTPVGVRDEEAASSPARHGAAPLRSRKETHMESVEAGQGEVPKGWDAIDEMTEGLRMVALDVAAGRYRADSGSACRAVLNSVTPILEHLVGLAEDSECQDGLGAEILTMLPEVRERLELFGKLLVFPAAAEARRSSKAAEAVAE